MKINLQSVTALDQGAFERKQPKLFTKDVLPTKSFTDPNTGNRLDFTTESLESMAETANRWVANGHKISYPMEHTDSPEKNEGFWKNFRVEEGTLLADVEVADEKIAEKMAAGTIAAVSPAFVSSFTDSNGDQYDNLIYHVAATNKPVIPDQAGFIKQFSTILVEGEKPMKEAFVKLSAMLGEPGASEARVLELAQDMSKKVTELSTKVSGLEEAVKSKDGIIEEYKNAEEKRVSEEREGYILSIQQKATEAGAPVEEAKLETLKKLFEQGLDEIAKQIGDDYVETAKLSAKLVKAPSDKKEDVNEEFEAEFEKNMKLLGIAEEAK